MTLDSVPLNHDFRHRRQATEVMDDPDLDERLHFQALSGLSRVNRISATANQLWPYLRRLADELGRKDLRVLDIATGGGDVAIRLRKLAVNAGYDFQIDGCDISTTALKFAKSNAERQQVAGIRFFELDVLNAPVPQKYDVAVSTLFLHHLATDEADHLLKAMRQASEHLILVSDLRRSRFAYWLTWIVCRIISRSYVVHADGPLSVAAAFNVDEVRALAESAGLHNTSIDRRWPWRFILSSRLS